MTHRYIGIDPGSNGGIAWIDVCPNTGSETAYNAINLPKTDLDIYCHLDVLKTPLGDLPKPAHVWATIEKASSVRSVGRDTSAGSFKIGVGYGKLLMALTALRIPHQEVTPATWQRKLGCLTKGDKNVTKQLAQRWFPDHKVTHSRADALLIAEYGRRTTWERTIR